MAGNQPEERVALPVLRQWWRQMTFIHWRVDPAAVRMVLPDDLEPDVVDGSAWVSLTPFRVERSRVLGAPPVPFLSSFPETNVRTYVRTPDGRDGLWFLSLDVTNAVQAAGGRLIAAPYFVSTMSVERGETVRYRCRRTVGRPAAHDIEVRPGRPLAAGEDEPLASLLAGRWRAFTRPAGRLLEVPVEHRPWPLRRCELVRLDETLLQAAGLPPVRGEPLVHHSEGVDARLGSPRPA